MSYNINFINLDSKTQVFLKFLIVLPDFDHFFLSFNNGFIIFEI